MTGDVTDPKTPARAGVGGRGARQRILAAAMNLFYRDGINATGVERLATEAAEESGQWCECFG